MEKFKPRLERLLLWVYVILTCVVYTSNYERVYDKKVDLNGDNVNYYLLGSSLAAGNGYKNMYSPDNNPNGHFPPGYPAIVATVLTFMSPSIDTVKRANGILLLVGLVFIALASFRFTKNVHLSFATIMLVIFNPSLMRYAVIMMSEIPFVVFSIITLWMVSKMNLDLPWFRNKWFYASLISLGISYYIRTAGIALLAGIALYLIFEKKWKFLMAYMAGLIIIALPWFIRSKMLGLGSSYLSQLIMVNPYHREKGVMGIADFLSRIWSNTERYITREIPIGLYKYPAFDYKSEIQQSEWILGLLILSVCAFGMWKLTQFRRLVLGYVLGTLGILLAWPEVWTGPRFIMPLIPVLILLFVNGIYELGFLLISTTKLSKFYFIKMAIALLPLICIPLVLKTGMKHAKNAASSDYNPRYKRFFQIAQYAAENTPNDAIICNRKGQLFYLFSGRKSVNYAYTKNEEDQIKYMQEKGVDFVVVDQLGYSSIVRYLQPAMKKYPEKFPVIKVIKNPDTYFTEFKPELGYMGNLDSNNLRQGFGRMGYTEGVFYEGEWKNGLRHGHGKMRVQDGKLLVGSWQNDMPHGHAEIYDENGRLIQRVIYKNGEAIEVSNVDTLTSET